MVKRPFRNTLLGARVVDAAGELVAVRLPTGEWHTSEAGEAPCSRELAAELNAMPFDGAARVRV